MNTPRSAHQPKVHWQFPLAAKFGRVIPKEKIYQQAGANAELKQLFIEQVGQIQWAYKLAENTINLAKTDQVDELEVIHIKLKSHTVDEKILAAIDKAIPHPTVFMLTRQAKVLEGKALEENEISYQAAHKRKTTTQNHKETWQQSVYLKSQWISQTSQLAISLPAATNLERLYHRLLEALMPFNEQETQKPYTSPQGSLSNDKPRSLEEKLADLAAIEALNKQMKQLKVKRDKEKQFNRKRELNEQYKNLNKQLLALKSQ